MVDARALIIDTAEKQIRSDVSLSLEQEMLRKLNCSDHRNERTVCVSPVELHVRRNKFCGVIQISGSPGSTATKNVF